MKYLALCLLGLVVLAAAKPSVKKIKSRQKRQDNFDLGSFDFGSFDLGSFDFGSFDIGSLDFSSDGDQNFDVSQFENLGSDFNPQGFLGSIAGGFQSMIQAGTDVDSFAAGFDALASSFDQFGGDDFDESKLKGALGDGFTGMMSAMSQNIPDPMDDPEGFAAYADKLGGQLDQHGSVGSSLINSFFDTQLQKGMEEFGLSGGFADGEIEASEFFEQMDTDTWKVMSKLSKKKSLFKVDNLNKDDFFGLMDMASSAPDAYLDTILAIDQDTSQLTPDILSDIPPEVFAAMDPTTFGTAAANFSEEQVTALCNRMEDTDSETAMTLFASVDCTDSFLGSGKEMDPEYEEAMFNSLRANKPIDQWTENDWDKMSNFAGGFEPEDLDSMPPASLLKNFDKFAGQVDDMDEEDIFTMIDGMESAIGGDFSQMTSDNLKKMGGMIQYMDPEDFSQIPPNVLLDSLDSFAGQEFDAEFAAEMAEELFDIMPPLDQWTGSEFSKCVDILKYDEDSLDEIPMDAIAGAIDMFGSFNFDEDEATNLAGKFLSDQTFGNPGNWNSTMIAKMGPVLSGFTADFFEQVPTDTLIGAWGAMNDSVRNKVEFNRASSRTILDKLKTKFGGMSNVPIRECGQLLKSATSEEIALIGGSDIHSYLGLFNNVYDEMDASSRRAVIERFKLGPGGLAQFAILGHFFKDLTMEEIDQLPYNAISPSAPPNPPIDVLTTPAQARRGWQNIVNMIGEPSKAAGNWSVKMWKGLGNVICGISCDEARKLPHGKKTGSILQMFASHERRSGGCLSDGQMSCVADRLKGFFIPNGTVQHRYATKPNLKKAARFLTFFNPSELNLFNKSVCSYVLNNIGSYELTNLPRKNLISIKNYLLNCTGKAASGEKITLKELRSVGDIMCGLEVGDIGNLENKIFLNYYSKMQERCDFPLEIIDALYNKVVAKMNITSSSPNITESQLMKLGSGIINLDDSLLEKIPDKIMMKGLARVKKAIASAENKTEQRELLGLGTDIAEADKAEKAVRKQRFYAKAANVVVAKREAEVSTVSPSRKRRAVTYSSLTCTDIKKMGSGVTSLTTDQLNLANAEFSSCYEFLGQQTGWSSAQKTQIATTAVRVWGAASSWTSSKLILSGTIAQGLSTSDLQSITFTKDIVSALGKYSGWTSDQLSAIYNKYITDTQGGNSNQLDASEMQALGNFICGASTTSISEMQASAYKGASTPVGTVTVCSQTQLTGFAVLAKSNTAYGAISTWSASTVASIGTVMGGLTASEISTLSTSQIEGMASTTISNLPASVFAGFTSAQLSGMSTNQRRSISSTQAAYLSSDAKGTLQTSGDFVTSGNQNSGAESVNAFVALNIATVAFLLRAYIF